MRTRRFGVLTSLVGLAVGVALTWPLALHLGSAVLEDGTLDAFQFSWNLWWVRESVVGLHTHPFWTQYLFFPAGVPLLFHTGCFALGLLSIPLQLAAGVVTAHNVLVILAPALLFVSVAFLAREATGDPWAALLAGLLGTLTPLVIWVLPVIYLGSGWIPPALLALWWALQRRRRWPLVAAALSLLAFSVFVSQEYAMIAVALLGLDALLRLALADWLGIPRLWRTGSAVFFGLAGAFLGALALLALGNPAQAAAADQAQLASGFAIGFVTPPWGFDLDEQFWRVFYLGTLVLVLGPLAFWLAPRRAAYWALLALPLLLMVLGPVMHWQPPNFHLPADAAPEPRSGLPGLYAAAGQLFPLLRFLRTPYRWMAGANPVLAVLAGVGAAALRSRVERPPLRAALTAVLLGLAVCLAALEHRGLRAPLVSAEVPSVYAAAARDPQPSALLDLPSGMALGTLSQFSSRYMYYQTSHGKFLLEGTVSRLPPHRLAFGARPVNDFARLPYVKYVAVHRDLLERASAGNRAQAERLTELAGRQGRLVARDATTDLYELDTFRAETVQPD